MVLSEKELIECFNTLEILNSDGNQLTLKQATKAFQRLALLTHPDKSGKESAVQFLKVREAYEKIRAHFTDSEVKEIEPNFFQDNFHAFSFPHENKGSFTVKIEDELADIWNKCITLMLGNPTIKKNLKGTETDRYWKVDNYMNTEITAHLYIRPKNNKLGKQ